MKLDLILPLYKPHTGWAEEIAEAVKNLRAATVQYGELYLYITNDGAAESCYPESSLSVVREAADGRFQFLPYEKNRGKGYSLRHLVDHADGDYIVYTDGDFPFGWEAVAETFKLLISGSDVVMGRRDMSYKSALSPFRKFLSGGVKMLNYLLCGLPDEISDTQAGLKGFNRRGREVFLQTEVDTFVFDTEFIMLAYFRNLKITTLDTKLRQGLTLSSMGFKVMFRELFCMTKVWWKIRVRKQYAEKAKPKLLLSFDIEEFDLPEEYGVTVAETDKYEIAGAGTAALLDLLEKENIRVTFFTTAAFAERFPELMRRMRDGGHETASHGMNHSDFEVCHLRQSAKKLRNFSGTDVIGFRMPRLAVVDKEDIHQAGYIYESSLNPVWLPGRYCNLTSPLLPFREKCGLWQFPISAVPIIRFPLFWLAFKNMPLPLYKMMTAITVKMTGYYNMYSHPWEYSAAAKNPEWKIPGYIVRHAGQKQLDRLASLIGYMKKRGEFITFSDFLDKMNNN